MSGKFIKKASANIGALGVPSSPATSEPQKRASAFPGTRRRELLPGEAWVYCELRLVFLIFVLFM